MSRIVEVSGLSFAYEDGTAALQCVDLDLEEAATIALLGPNGSGKTTFAHHLNGLLRGEGSIVIDGLPMCDRNLIEIRRRVGLVFQDSDNQLFMPTVLEDVAFGLLASGTAALEAEARAAEALRSVGMLDKAAKSPWQLSAGEKKKAAIAGVLACRAKLLVLDEPTTFLDPPGVRSLALLLEKLPQAKILITHTTDFARRLTDEACFFLDGKVAARGKIDTISRNFGW